MNGDEREIKEAYKTIDRLAQKGMKKLSKENSLLAISLYELSEALKSGNDIKLKSFENLIDKKYWNEDALFYISMAITCGVADTLEKAIAMYEEFNMQ